MTGVTFGDLNVLFFWLDFCVFIKSHNCIQCSESRWCATRKKVAIWKGAMINSPSLFQVVFLAIYVLLTERNTIRQLWKNMLDRMIPQNQYSKAGAIPATYGTKISCLPRSAFRAFFREHPSSTYRDSVCFRVINVPYMRINNVQVSLANILEISQLSKSYRIPILEVGSEFPTLGVGWIPHWWKFHHLPWEFSPDKDFMILPSKLLNFF